MSNRNIPLRLLAMLAMLLALVGVVAAQDTQPSAPGAVNWPAESSTAAQDAPSVVPAAPAATTVRFAHLAPFAANVGATSVTLKIDGANVVLGFTYGEKTDYHSFPAGNHQVQVVVGATPVLTKTIEFIDGPQSLVITGLNTAEVPLNLLLLADTEPAPAPGQATLRVAHVAPIGNTIEATLVDICSQNNILLNPSAAGLRYLRSTDYRRSLDAVTYNLKVTRAVESAPCTGAALIPQAFVTLPAQQVTTLYLIGDGTNQKIEFFTFVPLPVLNKHAYLPFVRR